MSAVAATRTLAPSLPNVAEKRWTTFASIVLADLVALAISGVLAVAVRYYVGGELAPAEYLRFIPALGLFFLAFAALGLYPGVSLNPVDEFRRILNATTIAFLTIIALTFLEKNSASYSRGIFVLAWVLSVVLLVVSRTLVRTYCAGKSWWGIPVVVLGAGKTAHELVALLNRHKTIGFRPVAVLDDDAARLPLNPQRPGGPIYGRLSLAPFLASHHNIRYAIVAMPGMSSKELSRVVSQYAGGFNHILIIPDLFGLSSLWVSAKDVGGMLGLEVSQPLIQRVPQIVKRGTDLLLGASVCLAFSPLLAVLYLAVRLSSPGPVFYGQRRVGRNNQPFTAWKFRSMIANADAVLQSHLASSPELQSEWDCDHKLKRDPRVTWIGRLLRKTSLDELPQIWNVLRGDMSFVGPRPIVTSEIAKYGECFELYRQVRPGITGLWQVSGRNNTTYLERVRFDEYYVRNWSVLLDLYILGRTVKTVLFTEGAY